MLMAQFGFKICWQAVFLCDRCSCITPFVWLYVFIWSQHRCRGGARQVNVHSHTDHLWSCSFCDIIL